MDDFTTKVIFRVYPQGYDRVIALFPFEVADVDGKFCLAYQHVGQHGAADFLHVWGETRNAQPDEYAELKAELERIGYRLEVVPLVEPPMFDVVVWVYMSEAERNAARQGYSDAFFAAYGVRPDIPFLIEGF